MRANPEWRPATRQVYPAGPNNPWAVRWIGFLRDCQGLPVVSNGHTPWSERLASPSVSMEPPSGSRRPGRVANVAFAP